MFTTTRFREIELTKFGGHYTEADQRDLPMGASPQNWDVDYLIAGVGTRPGLSNPITSFSAPLSGATIQYLKSASLTGGLNETIAQDSAGKLWAENLTNSGIMTKFYSGILNSARATSETIDQHEFICLSDLSSGSDQPRQWDGTNLDRISQVGPGAGPSVPSVAAPTFSISSITEIYTANTIDTVVWGSFLNTNNAPPPSPNLYFMGVGGSTTFLTGLAVGDIVYVSGVGNLLGQNPNGTYTVTSIGFFTDSNGVHQYFGVTASVAVGDFIRGSSGGTYQKTQALVQLSNPIPQQDAVAGVTIGISGSNVQGWNAAWKIVGTPTEGQLSITATSLTSNVATYTYTLVSGTAPGWQPSFQYLMGSQIVSAAGDTWQITTPGKSGGSVPSFASSPQSDGTATWTKQTGVHVKATIFNTSNGNGVFNVQNATITAASSTTFTVAITAANVSSASEIGQAISGSGTALVIDPGTVTQGTGSPGTSPIYGNATGGQVLPTSAQVAPGQRYAVLMFLTRNEFITQASPPVSFFTTGETSQVTFNNLAIGPPNVIARIVAITGANSGIGGPYFWIEEDVVLASSESSLGQTTTINKTIINDNTSTSLGPVNLSDTVLLDSNNVSEVGNNAQQQRELGECVKVVQWAGRAFYLGERTKVDTLVNMTFDGGSISGKPAGWTIATSLASYVSLVNSAIFGQSLYIHNTSGSTINPTGTGLSSLLTLYQGAFETAVQTPVIEPNTAYSVRVTAANPAGLKSGSLVIEFYSASLAQNWPATISMSGMTASLQEFTAAFSNPLWQPVPSDLVLRVYGSNLANTDDLTVDRIEVYPTAQPVYTTQVAASYAVDPEAIDAVTGKIDTSLFTSASQTNHFKFLNRYFITTESRTFQPIQNGTGEPGGALPWDINEISNAVGSLGPLANDVGEEYVLVASADGAYIFDGGSHVKLSQEIQQVWDMIYKPSKKTVWIKNDLKQQRILIGVPLPTPNKYLPKAASNTTPASPNVILMCSYLGLVNGAQIGEGHPVTVSMFTGSLLFHDMRRKWSIWQIPAAMSNWIDRADGSKQLWFGQAGGISNLDATQATDNGAAIASRYVTYGFSDTMTNERLQLGQGRKIYPYALANIEGSGKWTLTALPENINTPYPATQPAFTLASTETDDVNIPLNVTGNRVFLQIDSDGQPGTTWNLKRIDLAAAPDARIAVTGR